MLESRAAQFTAFVLSGLALAGVIVRGATVEASPIAGSPVMAGTSAGKTGGEAPPVAPGGAKTSAVPPLAPSTEATAQGNPTPESKTPQNGLCSRITDATLLEWLNSSGFEAVDCTGVPPGPVKGLTPRDYGRWIFPTEGSTGSPLASIEVAVYEDRQPDGSNAFQRLAQNYPGTQAHNIRSGQFDTRVVNAHGSTLANVPSEGLDVTFTIELKKETQDRGEADPSIFDPLHEAEQVALAELLPVVVNQ